MSTDSLADLPLHVFDFQAFECTNCGRCCNKRWKVTIDPHQIEGIQKSRAYQERTRVGYTPLTVDDDGMAKLGAHDGDYCVFFTEDRWCTLHGELGLYGKPRGCQLFPYHANDTPDGTFVTMSFACPPVVAGKDRDVDTNRADLQNVLDYRRALAPEPIAQDFRVVLMPDQEISWNSYRSLESRILDAYDPCRPYDSLLKIVLSVLRANSPGMEQWPPLATVDEDLGFAKEMLVKFVGTLIAALETRDVPGDRVAILEAVEQGRALPSRLAGGDLPPLLLEFSSPSLLPEIFDRFFHNMVMGKGLLKTSVIERLLTTLCGMALVQLYSAAYQHARGEAEESLESITLAFDLVEMNVVTHNLSLAYVFHGMTDTFKLLADLPIEEI